MTALLEGLQAPRREAPSLRARDAAARPGATEAALAPRGATEPAAALRPVPPTPTGGAA